MPPGLVVNPTTGAITGTLTAEAAANRPYVVSLDAIDGTYDAETGFLWTVNNPIVLTLPFYQSNNQGDTISLAVGATDATGGTLAWSATNLPSGLSIASSTGVVAGTASAGGFFVPTITVTDGTYSVTGSFYWFVSSTVSITDPGPQINQIGATVSLQVSTADTASGTLSYAAADLPTGLSISSTTGMISGTVSSSASMTTPYTTTITVGDGTNSAVDTFTWQINPSGVVVFTNPGSQNNAVGDEVALPIQVSDSSGGTLYYMASALPPGLYLNPSSCPKTPRWPTASAMPCWC